jgi:hypothetical protein
MRVSHTALVIAAAIAVSTPALPAQVLQGSQTTTGLVPKSGADSAYLTRLAAVQVGDTTTDLSVLRRQFALTTFYSPYSTDAGDRRQRMWARLQQKDEAGAGVIADSALAVNYLDADANLVSGISAGARGDTLAAARHIAIARGILASIESTGDGRASDRPLFVLSPAEEYSYLGARGLQRVGAQSLAKCTGGRPCDILEVAPLAGGEKFALFFDISLPLAHVKRQFEPAGKPK